VQQVDAEVLLQERDPPVHPLFQPPSLLLRIVGFGRVGVQPDAIAEAPAEHLPRGHTPGLARQIHAGHFDAADAAGLTGRPAELFDLAEHHVDVAGVLAEQAALEEERVGVARTVTHLAIAADALVRVEADDRTRHGRLLDNGHPQVGDLQRGGLRRALHVRLDERGGRVGVPRRRRAQRHDAARAHRFQKATAIEQARDCRLHEGSSQRDSA
jgi:hypothetical protein